MKTRAKAPRIKIKFCVGILIFLIRFKTHLLDHIKMWCHRQLIKTTFFVVPYDIKTIKEILSHPFSVKKSIFLSLKSYKTKDTTTFEFKKQCNAYRLFFLIETLLFRLTCINFLYKLCNLSVNYKNCYYFLQLILEISVT